MLRHWSKSLKNLFFLTSIRISTKRGNKTLPNKRLGGEANTLQFFSEGWDRNKGIRRQWFICVGKCFTSIAGKRKSDDWCRRVVVARVLWVGGKVSNSSNYTAWDRSRSPAVCPFCRTSITGTECREGTGSPLVLFVSTALSTCSSPVCCSTARSQSCVD